MSKERYYSRKKDNFAVKKMSLANPTLVLSHVDGSFHLHITTGEKRLVIISDIAARESMSDRLIVGEFEGDA